MDKKTQYCQDVNSSHLDQLIQYNLSQNPNRFLCVYKQTDCEVSMESQKSQNVQHNFEGEE